MKVFIATPITGLKKKEFDLFKEELKKLDGVDFFAEILKVNSEEFEMPHIATKRDIKKIKEADLFIMLHPKKMQTSTFFELGIAYSHDKHIIIYTPSKKELPFMIQELDKVSSSVFIIESENIFKSFYDFLKKNVLTFDFTEPPQ
jgi:nucleoside 2-deoxyribosyltransferase